MGAKGGPNIVDEGLIFYVDAANRKSWFGPDLDKVDEIITISTKDAEEKARHLAKKGFFVGISSGANVLAAEKWVEQNNPRGSVVTVLCDRGERYMSIL